MAIAHRTLNNEIVLSKVESDRFVIIVGKVWKIDYKRHPYLTERVQHADAYKMTLCIVILQARLKKTAIVI